MSIKREKILFIIAIMLFSMCYAYKTIKQSIHYTEQCKTMGSKYPLPNGTPYSGKYLIVEDVLYCFDKFNNLQKYRGSDG